MRNVEIEDNARDGIIHGRFFFVGQCEISIFMDILSGITEILSGAQKYCPEQLKYYPQTKNTIRTQFQTIKRRPTRSGPPRTF